jgi:ribosomal protein L11 methyltransferase
MLLISGFYEEDLPVLREKASSINLEFKSMRTENRWTAACFEAQ